MTVHEAFNPRPGSDDASGTRPTQARNLVVCCDGTGAEYGRNNTNVVETYQLVEKDDAQLAFYDPGIGTGGWEYHEDASELRSLADQATGWGLQKNVEDAYRFLMRTFHPRDRVFLFGFSRGAFTVRSLGGMLHKCGLLGPHDDHLVEYASKIYNTASNDDVAAGFRSTFARPCPVECIGVWDTVESLALNAGKRWRNASLNPEVRHGFHAVAIDEKRRDFPPCLWDEADIVHGQTIEQVWFSGVHADVGGWHDERTLANVALHWMLDQAGACGLRLSREALARHPPDPLGAMHDSYTGFWRMRGSRVRKIPEGAHLHRSVIERLQASTLRYRPRNLPSRYVVVD